MEVPICGCFKQNTIAKPDQMVKLEIVRLICH